MRLVTRSMLALLLLALLTFAAGCGSDSGSGEDGAERSAAKTERTGDQPDTEAGVPAPIDASLEIEMRNVASKGDVGIPIPRELRCTKSSPATCRGTVTCPAADDADETAFRVCAWLAERGSEVLAPVAEGREVCTMQYGGPEVATVVGTLGAKEIDVTFSRENGCAINRWDLAAPLWTGDVPPADPPGGGDGGAASGACLALPPDTPVSSDQPPAAGGAADEVCAVPATPAPDPSGSSTTPPVEPEIITDPPEAFER